MKKLILGLCALTLVVIACQDDSSDSFIQEEFSQIEVDMSDFYVYTDDAISKSSNGANKDKCHSMQVLNRQLKENQGLEKKMYDIEFHTRKAIAAKKPAGTPGGGPGNGDEPTPDPVPYVGSITIPVVINILESSPGNVTEAQIESQIKILNEDFKDGNLNTNTSNYFAGLVANVDITFVLADVNRKLSTKNSWGTRDTMKKSKRGGIDPTDPTNNLNIWVCEIGGGILGYAQFPGGSLATDGVVVTTSAFGETSGVYGDGRTATHEVGHYLNLRHIWGDGGCSVDDFVADTPIAGGPNYGCPGVVDSCDEGAGDQPDMTMNYMDYVYDDCMYMFTYGQNDRMRTLFSSGGARESFVN